MAIGTIITTIILIAAPILGGWLGGIFGFAGGGLVDITLLTVNINFRK